MRLIRKGTFETNSSSTHALVVPHNVDKEEYSLSDSLDHEYGFGRGESRLVYHWDEKLAYVYLVVKDFANKTDLNKFKRRINKLYKEIYEIVEYKPYEGDPKPNDIFKYIDSDGKESLGNINFISLSDWVPRPYVDHTEDFKSNGFLDKVLTDDCFLTRLIFNMDSYITVGGDEYRGYNIKTIGFEYDYKDKSIYCVNENGEEPPKEWFDKDGRIKDEYWDRYCEEYPYSNFGFWKKLKEYEKENDVFLKGN